MLERRRHPADGSGGDRSGGGAAIRAPQPAMAMAPGGHRPFAFEADVSRTIARVDRTYVGATLEDTSLSLYGGGLYSQLIYGEGYEEPRLEGVGGT
eukprot:SAG22_NODE_13779_length_395_cov_0.875000_1_plen_95_part_01